MISLDGIENEIDDLDSLTSGVRINFLNSAFGLYSFVRIITAEKSRYTIKTYMN